MKAGFLIAGLCVVLAAGSDIAAQQYYDSYGQVTIFVDSSKVCIKFDSTENKSALIAAIGRIDSELPDEWAHEDFATCSLTVTNGYYTFLDSLVTVNGILLAEPYYLDTNDYPKTVGETFCVAFKPELTQIQIDSINNANNVLLDTAILHNVVVLRNTDSSGLRLLEMANFYYDMTETEFSHPNFKSRVELFSYKIYDYYVDVQENIKMSVGDFNVATVWDFAGVDREVRVAVVDDGVRPHEDMPLARVDSGYNANSYKWPAYPDDTVAHGMGVAGIIAASHSTDTAAYNDSTSGMISMNPNAYIIPVKITGTNDLGKKATVITSAYKYGDAQVYNISWGRETGQDYPVITRAIDSAYDYGRNGRGCAIICASGNGANAPFYYPIVAWPANMSSTLAVGASELNGNWYYYSQYGPNLDLVAPSGPLCFQEFENQLFTLDQMGDDGYNPNTSEKCGYSISWHCDRPFWGPENNTNIDCKFGGTSAAAPIVAGIASLLISRDSMLTADQIYDVIRGSARPAPPDSQHYGSGYADAFRALLAITRADVDNTGEIDICDITFLVAWLWQNGDAPFPSPLLGDIDCTGDFDVSDMDYLVDYMFRNGPAPIKPCFNYGP